MIAAVLIDAYAKTISVRNAETMDKHLRMARIVFPTCLPFRDEQCSEEMELVVDACCGALPVPRFAWMGRGESRLIFGSGLILASGLDGEPGGLALAASAEQAAWRQFMFLADGHLGWATFVSLYDRSRMAD